MASLIFYTSNYSDLNAADAAASGGILVVDSAISLIGNLSLVTKQLTFSGGIISLGNYDLTGADTAIEASVVQIFSLNGTGRLKGRFTHLCFYPEWVGVQGVGPSEADPFTSSAVFAVANHTLLQAIEDYAGQRAGVYGGDVVIVKFTRYMTALSSYVTNVSQGICTTWEGVNPAYTRIYCSGGTQPRLLTGASSSSVTQDCYRSIGLFGNGPASSPLIDFQNWCGLTWRDVMFSNAAGAIRMQSTSVNGVSGYSENCGGINMSFLYDCGKPVQFTTTGGTGSFRGWFIGGQNIWAAGSTSAPSFITHGNGADGSFAYNGKILNLVFTNHNTGKIFNLFDGQSQTPISCMDGRIDIETAGNGSIVQLHTGYGAYFGGEIYGNGASIVYGGIVFAKQLTTSSTQYYVNRGAIYLENLDGYRFVLSAGTNALPYYSGVYHIQIYGGFNGILTAQIEVDADPIGPQNRFHIISWTRSYNASFAGFDDTMFGVSSSGNLTITNPNFPANTFVVTGTIDLFAY